MEKKLKQLSKLLSFVLRHEPEQIGLALNEQGWASVEELLRQLQAKGYSIDRETLQQIVNTNDKKRFAFNEDKTMIRANQGHSIDVDLDLQPTIPPDILYHGTAAHILDIILKEGLQKQQRHHVHLTASRETAVAVGSRHGKPVVIMVQAKDMQNAGYTFYLSQNNVWLVSHVAPEFLTTDEHA